MKMVRLISYPWDQLCKQIKHLKHLYKKLIKTNNELIDNNKLLRNIHNNEKNTTADYASALKFMHSTLSKFPNKNTLETLVIKPLDSFQDILKTIKKSIGESIKKIISNVFKCKDK